MQIRKKVIISSHVLNYGAPHALKEYLASKSYDILFIGLPFYDQKNVIVEKVVNGKTIYKKNLKTLTMPQVFSSIADFIRLVRIFLSNEQAYDTYVGVDNLNCFAGLVLKKVGKVKKVIYYSIDFVPIRFANPILNSIYHQLEIFGVRHADEVWNVSPRIAEGREEFLHISPVKYKQKVVPIGVWPNRLMHNTHGTTSKQYQALFVGHLLEKQGVQLIIESIPIIVKEIPRFSLLIIGDGEYMKTLKALTKRLKLDKYVAFLGWIFDRKELDKFMRESAIGFAVYKPEKGRLHNFSYFADPTKIKDYLSAGLPVILTDVSYNAPEIEKQQAGIIVSYKKEDIARAVIDLMTDSKKLKQYKDQALQLSLEFDWNKIFARTTL